MTDISDLEKRLTAYIANRETGGRTFHAMHPETLLAQSLDALAALSRERDEARERAIALQRQLKHEPARIRKLVLDIVHSEVEAAREVLSDFLNQGHLEYRVPGRASDYDRADAMIRDLEAEGLAIVPAAALAALSRERDEAYEAAARVAETMAAEEDDIDDDVAPKLRAAAVRIRGLSREGGKQDQGGGE